MSAEARLSFGIRFPPSEGPESTGRLARDAEAAGFSWVWGLDTPLIAGQVFDPYVDLVSCALSTTRVMLGPNVSPVYMRSPVATAAAILSLDRISNGRAVLGLGTGGSALVTLGVSQVPKKAGEATYTTGAATRRKVLEEQVRFFRGLFNGEPVSLGSREIRLERPRPVKIYLAASGPKMLELAGAIGDGVIMDVGIHPPILEECIGHVKRGARAAGRDPEAIEVVAYTCTSISPEGDRKRDIRQVKPRMSYFYSVLPHLLERSGFDVSKRFPDWVPHPDMTHAYDWEEAMAAADTFVSDDAAAAFSLVGPPDDAIRRIRQLAQIGVTQVYVRDTSSYALPHALVKIFAEHILPHFRGSSS